MKRSQINNSIETAIDVFNKLGINLPPFAFWSANEWDRKGKEVDITSVMNTLNPLNKGMKL